MLEGSESNEGSAPKTMAAERLAVEMMLKALSINKQALDPLLTGDLYAIVIISCLMSFVKIL